MSFFTKVNIAINVVGLVLHGTALAGGFGFEYTGLCFVFHAVALPIWLFIAKMESRA